MSTDTLRVSDVFRAGWEDYRQTHQITSHVEKVVRNIMNCRTAALGARMYRCDQCGSEVPIYNSCRDRNCPTCQTAAKEKWLDARYEELLPVSYFHQVFTLPHDLNALIAANRRVLIGELFHVVNWVLQHFAQDPQWKLEGRLGYMAILHTWNQKLLPHYHLHCLVPGGAWNEEDGTWSNSHPRFLFGKDPLAKAFQARFIKRLKALRRSGKLAFENGAAGLGDDENWTQLLSKLNQGKWVVYLKATSAGPEQVLEYLGRYTHRIAISDHRVLDISNGNVTFTWRDRSDANVEKELTISVEKFISRFIHHILPSGFRKIRYAGFLAAINRGEKLPAIRAALQVDAPENPYGDETLPERILRRTGVDITFCPHCKRGHLQLIETPASLPTGKPP